MLSEEEIKTLKYGCKQPIEPRPLVRSDILAAFDQFITA